MGNEVIAWDAATGKQRWRVDLQTFRIYFGGVSYGMRLLAFAPDGARLFTPGQRGTVLAWDVETGARTVITLEETLPPRAGNVVWDRGGPRAVDVSPDGRLLAVGGPAGVQVCDLNGRTKFAVENAPAAAAEINDANRDRLTFAGHACSGQFSPDGATLAVVASDAPNEVRLHDVATGAERLRIATTARVVRIAFSPDGKRIAATERDAAVRLYEVETGKPVWSHVVKLTDPFENYTSGLAFAPDGQSIAACATDERIYLLDAATGDEAGALVGHAWNPWGVAFTRDGGLLYSSGWDGHVCRWEVAARRQLPLPAGLRATGVVAIAPDGRRLAYEDDAGKVRLVDAATGAEQRVLELPGTQYSQLAFSPDSGRLAGGGTHGDDLHVAVWNLATGNVLHRWEWPKGRDPNSEIQALSFTTDGRRLAAASFRQDAALWWDLESGKQMARSDHDEIYGLAFHPDGQTLATVGWDSKIRIWNSETGEMLRGMEIKPDEDAGGGVFIDDDPRMYAVAFSPLGGLMATQHMNGEIGVWDAATLKLRTKIGVGGGFGYGSLSFSPDGLWIATGKSSGALSLWDARSGRMVWNAGAHQDTVYATGFGRDSRRLASGGDDGACYLWSLAPPTPHPSDDGESLWRDLASSEGPDAYRAMWALADKPERTIKLIAEKLRDVDALVDLQETEGEITPDEAARVYRLKRLLVDKDPSVESQVAARRAIALLSQIELPTALALLEELAARNSAGDLSRLAAEALRWRRSVDPR